MEIIAEWGTVFLVLAIIFGVYMTWGIGANDVAIGIGPLAAVASIVVSWVITLPVGGALEALFFFTLKGVIG